jgi:hypothetical protein
LPQGLAHVAGEDCAVCERVLFPDLPTHRRVEQCPCRKPPTRDARHARPGEGLRAGNPKTVDGVRVVGGPDLATSGGSGLSGAARAGVMWGRWPL